MSDEEDEEKELVQYTGNYGLITQDSKFWDDYEEMGETDLLNRKIVKIKIYTGTFKEKKAIFGFDCIFKNLLNGKCEKSRDHRGSEQFVDVKEFEIPNEEYLTDFHIRFTDEVEYISQLGFGTNKKKIFLVGTEEGEDKIIESNGGENIIIGTFGCVDKKLDAIGCLYMSKKDYIQKNLYPIYILRYLSKKDKNFKKKWDEEYKQLPLDFQYLWKMATSSDAVYSSIIKYCHL